MLASKKAAGMALLAAMPLLLPAACLTPVAAAAAGRLRLGDDARPPPPPPPDPCNASCTDAPQYHISNMGAGPHDANAIFHWKGQWHVMHQANWTDWAHLVSTDLVTWTRIPSALSPNGDWDGSLTILDGEPVIMYDCYNIPDCLPLNKTATAITTAPRLGLGDPPHVGVARPVDPSDANLTTWAKDPLNPISFPGMRGGFAGPSNLWRGPGGEINMAMALGRSIARFETTDKRMHNWTVADKAFLPYGANNGHGTTGMMFFPLPKAAPGASASEAAREGAGGGQRAAADELTHMLGGIWSDRVDPFLVGTPWFVLGRYDNATGDFTNATEAQPLDSGRTVIWSTVGQADDGRTLHLGWFNFGAGNANCLTVPREVTYDPVLQKLMALPIKEITALHGASLGAITSPVTVAAGGSHSLVAHGTSFDLEAAVALPAAGQSLSFTIAVLAATATDAEVLIQVNVTAAAAGAGVAAAAATAAHNVSVSVGVPGATRKQATVNTTGVSFLLPASEPNLALRVLADRSIVSASALPRTDSHGIAAPLAFAF
jgi:sucrose-6-phosphate hydrolase SacC (GH32 family)